ncbi:hypothetical protein NKDENANG_00170 [Candidatus Entotheonellaceae bacterium PAL068K]
MLDYAPARCTPARFRQSLLPHASIMGYTSILQYRRHGLFLGFFVLFGGLLTSLFGCGYTLVGAASSTSSWRLTLAVEPLINQTREPELESHMTAALRRALLQSQAFDLAAMGTAPRRLQGTVRRFYTLPVSFDANDNVLQYRLEATAVIRVLKEVSQETTLEQNISAWADYLVSDTGTVRETVVAKEAAILRLAQQFADKCTALLQVALL